MGSICGKANPTTIQPEEELPLTAASTAPEKSGWGRCRGPGECCHGPDECCRAWCRCLVPTICCIWVLLTVVGIVGGYSFVRVCSVPFTGIDIPLHAVGLVCKEGNIAVRLSDCSPGIFNCQFGMGKPFTPVNVSDSAMPGSLWTPECTGQDLLDNQRELSSENPFELISFPSRKGEEGQPTINITAWWLPAPGKDGKKAPRIVMSHGNNVNFNDNTVQLPAYMLRELGFSVLLPNLRDHGSSGNSTPHEIIWGYAYHLDLLGAWDYAVNDPEGVLGGRMPDERVGIMGYSMGGFAAAIAFGVEPRVPAAWLDSAVFDLGEELTFNLALIFGFLPPSVLSYMTAVSLWFGSYFAGANIELYQPASSLTSAAALNVAKRRPVAVLQSTIDSYVGPEQSAEFAALFGKHNASYDLSLTRRVKYSCGVKFPFTTHCQMHTWQAQTYKDNLCEFWSRALGRDTDYCLHLPKVPPLGQSEEAYCPGPPAEVVT
mmetsp:Transcript_78913/g.142336  ORF Transcript_78913/g.142336 Transcript_78913/m.142336 type:complete len:488 (+) Transcript_78913:41-1504(+)